MDKHYADRDHMELGNYYTRHVQAMTAEGLHAKSDIAAELAWRDREIDRLRALSPAGGGDITGYTEALAHIRATMLAASPQQEPGPAINSSETYSKPIADPNGQTLAGAGGTLVAGSRGKYLYLPGVSIKSAAPPKSGAVPFDVLSIASEMEAACPHYAGPDVDYSVDASKVHTWAQALRATQPATSAGTTGDALPELPEPEGEMKWTRSAGVCIRPEPGYDADQMREYARRAREVG